uniref:BLTX852 n=1 Tax=Nephila pilipes TaxID=299642 RepID=A0A076L108_NEPPI|nr:BLTX852 [Nephila pilipes]
MQAFVAGVEDEDKDLIVRVHNDTETKSPLDVKPWPVDCQLQLI